MISVSISDKDSLFSYTSLRTFIFLLFLLTVVSIFLYVWSPLHTLVTHDVWVEDCHLRCGKLSRTSKPLRGLCHVNRLTVFVENLVPKALTRTNSVSRFESKSTKPWWLKQGGGSITSKLCYLERDVLERLHLFSVTSKISSMTNT